MIKYPFKVFQTEVEGRVFWIAKSSYLKGCVGQGDDISEALSEFEENEKAWLETAEEEGIPLPKIDIEHINDYSGKMTLRLAPFVHMQAALNADREGISLNQYINNAVVSQNALMNAFG
ncbi:MAG TPA: toxin-antitoxin system HicB family antitoxin [Lachnospiraceae bacterium]|nr:toxin-antitoxin system HicB family antitoxin [Lachnospiraceae bacterium]